MNGGSVMYGGPPWDGQSSRQAGGITGRLGDYTISPSPAPESAAETQRRMRARVEWLKRELSMHAAWTEELALLERMLAAVTP